VLDYKIIYIRVIIENTTGMPHLEIMRNTSKDTTETWKFTANQIKSKETACCIWKQYRFLAWRNSTFRKYVVKFSV